MPHKKVLWILLAWLGLLWCPAARGGVPDGELLNLEWQVYVAAKPIYAILVEKDRQRLRVLRHDGRLRVVAEYAVATGENPGPKEKEGDAKTPEGIYRITKGFLDRRLTVFGNRAYELNYPNVFDLGAGRSGNGIYIHGTNRPLRPASSNGCVTLQNSDLDALAGFLVPGTPVFIVPSLDPPKEGEGQEGGVPDLAGHGFAGAKDLLIPAAGAKAEFASLYRIRINGQTVVAGEYWADGQGADPQSALAYVERTPDQRWTVVDREPMAVGLGKEEPVLIADSRPEWRPEPPPDSPLGWRPEPLTLAWYREANRQESGFGRVESGQVPAPVAVAPGGVRVPVVHLLFGLATCLGLGSALVLVRRQRARIGAAGAVEQEPGDENQVARLRDEARQAREISQARSDEEVSRMESQEALQARIKGLEEAFLDREAALAQLSAEQAALKREGIAERSGQAEALAALRCELEGLKGELEAARLLVAATVARETMVREEMAEVRRLAAVKEGEEAGRAAEIVAALRTHTDEMQALRAEMAGRERELGAAWREAAAGQGPAAMAEQEKMEAALLAARQELAEERAARSELTARLSRIGELEAALAGRDEELEALREANELAAANLATEKSRLEAALAELVLARQVEVTSLTNTLQEVRAKAAIDQENLATLGREVEALNETSRRTTEREQAEEQRFRDQELVVAGLRQEVMAFKARVAELEQKAATGEGVVLIKGAHYLPGDVLRQWIGKGEGKE